jgi:3',5'-cyclic AMP phosphodiesterase CpdA
MPVYLIPGNHDRRGALREVFGDWSTFGDDPEFIDFAADVGPAHLIGVDSVVPGRGHGALCARRLDRLRSALAAASDRPTLVALHHPPFVCGIEHMDGIRLLEGAEDLARIIADNPQVERVLCGHHHRPIQTRWAGTLAQIAPSVAHQVEFRLDPGAEGMLVLEPPAFLVHAWIEGTGMVTHQVYVERHDGPYPFTLDPDYPGGT